MPDEPNNQTPPPEQAPKVETPSLLNQDPPAETPPPEEKKLEEKPTAPEPLTIESFTIPEDFESSDEAKTKFVEILNNQELSPPDRAQALIDLQTDVMRQASEKLFDSWRETQAKWQEEVKADPELGGAKMSENLAGISKLFETYGAKADANAETKAAEIEELRKAMDYTGAGNNPTIIRFLHRIAKELNEPSPVSGAPTGQASTPESRIYPTMAKS